MLTRFLSPLKSSPIGVDITDQAVRLVSLGRQRNRLYLRHAAQETLPSSVVVDGVVQQPEALASALTVLIKRSGLRKPKAVIAAAAHHTQTHTVSLESKMGPLDSLTLEQEVLAELDAQIHHAIEDFYIDFQAAETGSSSGLTVEVKCVPKALYHNTLSALVSANMTPEIMDIAPLALAHNPWQDIEVNERSIVEGIESEYALSAALAMRGMS